MEYQIDNTSPYLHGSIVIYDDNTYSLEPPANPKSFHNKNGNDVKHEVVEGQTLESLSRLYYHNSKEWHNIATYNPDIWDFNNLEPGKIITIPNPLKFRQ